MSSRHYADWSGTARVLKGFPVVALLLLGGGPGNRGAAETGYDAWLRYASIGDDGLRAAYESLPAVVVAADDSPVVESAVQELIRGVRGVLGRTLRIERDFPDEPCVVIGTVKGVSRLGHRLKGSPPEVEGYRLAAAPRGGDEDIVITGGSPTGALYGTFALLRKLSVGDSLAGIDEQSAPAAPLRVLNHWDNLDGTIERGYAGPSIFWEEGRVAKDLSRVRDYARLLASLGINGTSINNVNADVRVISPEYLPEVARIAEVLRPWGVKMYISLDFASPQKIGGIDTFDPLDRQAVEFWQRTIDDIYKAIPDLGGFVLKADSEGRLGPSEYGRTPADAANAIARPLKARGGVLFYRGFVYNHKMDWRDLKNDRATAAYDNFHKLDGMFEDNVVIQIKHGPIDFQVREPPSPLFSGLERTNQAVELQITQEYLGQQRHLCYLAPMWKEVLDFDMHAGRQGTPVKELVAGKTFDRPLGGFVGVSNVGRDANWLGHHLAMANLYAFGRLAWDPDLSSEEIAEQWTRQTFGMEANVTATIVNMLMRSWSIYESYTGPLGIGTLTDIIHIHFGPAPESSEYNGWGQWHRANETGVGMDRTVATGTGFTTQYRPPVAAMFESLDRCPDDLLLFFHHVPYSHELESGKTVIQHFYDAHYDGAEQAEWLVDQWVELKGRIDEQRFHEVLDRLEYQQGHAQVWRDAICNWFLRKSGIADNQGRVGNYPSRLEAEDQSLMGYTEIDITPWEAASGSRAVELPTDVESGEVHFAYDGPQGWFDLRVQYFDENDGESRFEAMLGEQLLDEWTAPYGTPTPTTKPDAHSSTRRAIRGVALRPGDVIRIRGYADQGERAGLDYLEIAPSR